MKAASISFDSNLPLFRPLIYYKKGNSYSLRSSRLFYSRCRNVFKSCLKELGLDPKCYSLHSLRSGITSVVHHSGNSISDRILKLHGCWKTDAAKDMYGSRRCSQTSGNYEILRPLIRLVSIQFHLSRMFSLVEVCVTFLRFILIPILDVKKISLLIVDLFTIVTNVLISVKINSFYSARASILQPVVFLFLILQGV